MSDYRDAGQRVVDMLMSVALDESRPQSERDDARTKLRACAHRQMHQTVRDVVRPQLVKA